MFTLLAQAFYHQPATLLLHGFEIGFNDQNTPTADTRICLKSKSSKKETVCNFCRAEGSKNFIVNGSRFLLGLNYRKSIFNDLTSLGTL
jgi:hypothetical protein